MKSPAPEAGASSPRPPPDAAGDTGGPDAALARAVERAQGDASGDLAEDGSVHPVEDAGRIIDLPAAQLRGLLDRLLVGDAADAGLEHLRQTGLLGVLLPEVAALVGFHATCRVHHKDLWAHTRSVLVRTPPDADLRWAALFHDVGKVATRVVEPRGKVSFLRHERLGAWLWQGAAARLDVPAERVQRVAFIIEHHARVNAYESSWTDRAVRRLMREAGDHLDDLLAFSAADYTTGQRRLVARIRRHLVELEQRIEGLREADAEAARGALPRGLGHAIAAELGLSPGPAIGDHVARVRAAVQSGELPSGQDQAVYVAWLRRAHGEDQPA